MKGFFWALLVTVHLVGIVRGTREQMGFLGNFVEKFDLAGPAGTVGRRVRCKVG